MIYISVNKNSCSISKNFHHRTKRCLSILRGIYFLKLLKELSDFLSILDGKEGSQEFNKIFTLFVDMESSRYLNPRDPIPQSDGIRRLLQQFPDGTFKQIVRCSKLNFARIVDFIKDDPIFTNRSLFSQYSVEIQLMVTLNRLGCDGNGASVGALGRMFGISYGTTVHNFTNRVFRALYNRRDQIIFWPNEGIFLTCLCYVALCDWSGFVALLWSKNGG